MTEIKNGSAAFETANPGVDEKATAKAAFERSGLTETAWNELSWQKRDELMTAEVARAKGANAQVTESRRDSEDAGDEAGDENGDTGDGKGGSDGSENTGADARASVDDGQGAAADLGPGEHPTEDTGNITDELTGDNYARDAKNLSAASPGAARQEPKALGGGEIGDPRLVAGSASYDPDRVARMVGGKPGDSDKQTNRDDSGGENTASNEEAAGANKLA